MTGSESTGSATIAASDEPEIRGVRRVPVDGGSLAVRDLTPGADADAPLVLLVHGITANGATWSVLAAELARRHGRGVRVWAPDLRGRALSRTVTQPAGIAAHVADLAAVLDDARLGPDGRATLVGHSMGGFVATLAAATWPERMTGAILVDGGFAFPPPADLDVDAALAAVIGPAMDRLSMRFDTPKAYVDFWSAHPAVGPLLTGDHADAVRTYLLSDLVPADDGGYVSSCSADVIRVDGAEILTDADVLAAGPQAAHEVPMHFLWAERGLLNQNPGLYTADLVDALRLPGSVEVTAVRDVDHYGIVFADRPLGLIGDAIDAAMAR